LTCDTAGGRAWPETDTMKSGIRIIMRDPSGEDRWLLWANPIATFEAERPDEILPLLAKIDEASLRGEYAIGFIAYEAGVACDPAFTIHGDLLSQPLAWFAVFKESCTYDAPTSPTIPPNIRWQSPVTKSSYRRSIRKIKDHIAAGDTYQVNFTFPLLTYDHVDPLNLFFGLYAAQPSPYAMYIETPSFQIASVSPELFFTLDDHRISCEPMKGTSPRGLHPDLDSVIGHQLQHSAKNRAENVMIVDMVRNDLSRIATPGSVQVDELFKVTRWPTLWQMTSTVSASTDAAMPELFTALFPCASITGAPKLKTSEIIADVESTPRGVYTGAIGWWFPNRQARFAVAIRTAITIKRTGQTRYGIGSGIVWDSDADDEYRECLLKSRILRGKATTFRLLETMRWEHSRGYVMLDEHVRRIQTSAEYFGFNCDPALIREQLRALALNFSTESCRVRLLLDRDGVVALEHQVLTAPGHYSDPSTAPAMTGALDRHRIDTNSPFLYHKTTRRAVYDQARRRFPGIDEVILVNTRDELMEFTSGNLVIKKETDWLTPEITSGLLPGVFRDHLIARGEIKPARLTPSDLHSADNIYFINSVRGWRKVMIET